MSAEPIARDVQLEAFAQVCRLLDPFVGPADLGPDAQWTAIERFAEFHGVRPALFKALAALPAAAAPAALQQRLAEFQRLHRFRVMQTTGQIVALAQALAAADITALFFKGATLGEQIYGGAQYREFNDVDVLVAPCQRRRAEQVIEACGYVPVIADLAFRHAFFDYFRQHNFRHQPSATTLDFHWGFVGTGPFPVTPAAALASPDQIEQAGTPIHVPTPQVQALILAGHGHKEGWAAFGWVLDFATFAARNPALRWDQAARTAAAQGCLEPLLGAVLLVQRAFGAVIDQPLLSSALRRAHLVRAAEAVALSAATLSERQLANDLMGGFNLCETPRQRGAMALSLLTTPTIGDYEAMPLPARWWGLYRLSRPVRLALVALVKRAPVRSALWQRANRQLD